MNASRGNVGQAFPQRTILLVGILAILTGILGMHAMSSTHIMHSPYGLSTVSASPAHDASGGHDTLSLLAEKCSCSDGCASGHTMAVACTPSGKAGSLSVPLPGAAGFDVIANSSAPAADPASYSYRPGSPSPGALSISRT